MYGAWRNAATTQPLLIKEGSWLLGCPTCATLSPMKLGTRILWAVAAAGVAGYAALTLWLALSALLFPYAVDYGEGAMLWFARKMAAGQSIYTTLPGPPFDSSNYPPIATVLTVLPDLVVHNALLVGRGLNFLAVLVVTALIARIVRVESRDLRAALLAAGLFIGSTFVYHWTPLYRVDLIGLAFAFGGIFFVRQWERRLKHQPQRSTFDANLIAALVLFLLALYTKHSLFFAPIAAVAAIFLRDKRTAIFFALVLGVIGGAIFGAMELVTRGAWSFGLVALNATVWTPRVFIPLASSFLLTYAVLVLFAAYGWWQRAAPLITSLRTRAGVSRGSFGVLEIYAVLAVVSIALAGREGAWENYFLEIIAIVCVFAGLAFAALAAQPRGKWLVPALLLVQLGLFWNEHDPRIAQRLFDDVRAGNESLAPLLRASTGTLISEDMGLLWVNHQPVTYYSFPYSTLARAGRYDQAWEIENLRAGNFPLVILNRGTRDDIDHFGNFTRAFASALDYGYALTQENTRYSVYTPAPLEHFEPTANFGETFELVGWSLEPDELKEGGELALTVLWRATQQPLARYTMFAHLEGAEGKIAQDDHEPHGGLYPTTRWAAGEMVRDTFRLRLPPTIAPGEYVLRLGWYDTLTQDRLSREDGNDTLDLLRLTFP